MYCGCGSNVDQVCAGTPFQRGAERSRWPTDGRKMADRCGQRSGRCLELLLKQTVLAGIKHPNLCERCSYCTYSAHKSKRVQDHSIGTNLVWEVLLKQSVRLRLQRAFRTASPLTAHGGRTKFMQILRDSSAKGGLMYTPVAEVPGRSTRHRSTGAHDTVHHLCS